MALGELEQVVLLAMIRLGAPSHGADFIDEIEERTGKTVSPGALYTVLGRLEAKRFVRSWIGDSIPERGGRRRKVYEILPEGASALREWYAGIQDLAAGIEARLDRLAGEAG